MTAKNLGDVISEKRKEMGVSLRELAERIKKEDGKPITPQYLNDIEHNNRKPSEVVIDSLAEVLKVDQDYLRILAGSQPEGLSRYPQEASDIIKAFRRHIKGDKQALSNAIKKLENPH